MKAKIGSRIRSFDGTKIYYDKRPVNSNKNHAILFLHGLGGDLSVWDKERDFFSSEGIPTIATDLRGHGFSDRSDDLDFYKFDNFANDAIAIMKHEGYKKYTVVGHCLGGMVALVLEGSNPRSAENLVLVDTGFKPPLLIEPLRNNPILLWIIEKIVNNIPNFKIKGHADFNKFIGTKDVDLVRFVSDVLHVSMRSYLLISENLIGYNASKLLDRISVPTLIIEGEMDTIFPPDVARQLKKRIKRSEIDFINGANHILVTSNPLDLAREIERFLIKRGFL